MKRTTTVLGAFAAAATLLLAGCGSDTTGTAAPASPTSSAAMSSDMAPSSDASSAPSSDSSSSDASSSDSSSSDASSSDTSSSDASSSSADTAPTTTVGGEGTLDEASTKWFDTYCSGVSPALEEAKKLGSAMSGSSSDPKAMFKALSGTFTTMGNAFTDTAQKLDGVPAPTFNGGDTLASTVLKVMKEYGPKFTELGTDLAKADPSDPKTLQKLQSLGSDMQGLQDLAKFKVDARTLAAIKEVPSCTPLFSMGG